MRQSNVSQRVLGQLHRAGDSGVSVKELLAAGIKNPHSRLYHLRQRKLPITSKRVGQERRYVLSGTSTMPRAPRYEPIRSREQELWDNFVSARKKFRESKRALGDFLAETR